ncbi:DUF2807 domain-containing protein [Sphingomonas panacisoli]|uniref:DUF2807 domain-containing protein n=1 Tax=Sphingomonas panacisoli TaxID=1813879 RepID=A0A5B8LN99_9SPHN|nr:DUF2807 domain-containing protein [Sphingomonas panacisoli]QDZ08550.1 DUF2807 domain-containing protein [Sphingomonas panacisoli]
MIRYISALALSALALPASAADRTFTITSFDRIRVEGPFDVRLTVGNAGASAKASGDAEVIGNLDIDVQGTTLVIRKGTGGWGERGKIGGPAPVITLVTSNLRTAAVVGGGKLVATGKLRSQKLDFQINGAGSIDAQGVDSDELSVTIIGTGTVALAGRSGRARMLTNGPGTIMAIPLVVSDLVVRLDGPGETQATARFTADLTSTGLGRIVVTGGAKCTTNAQAGGPILCGPDATP